MSDSFVKEFDEEIITIPDSAYSNTLDIEVEPWLQDLIDEVIEKKEHEPSKKIQIRQILEEFWNSILPAVKEEYKIPKMMMMAPDSSGNYCSILSMGFHQDSNNFFNLAYNDKLLAKYLLERKIVKISKNLFKSTLLSRLYQKEDKSSIMELFFIPIIDDNDVIGIIHFAVNHELNEENKNAFLKLVISKCVQWFNA